MRQETEVVLFLACHPKLHFYRLQAARKLMQAVKDLLLANAGMNCTDQQDATLNILITVACTTTSGVNMSGVLPACLRKILDLNSSATALQVITSPDAVHICALHDSMTCASKWHRCFLAV